LGDFKNKEDAIIARQNRIEEEGYHANHGQDVG